MCVCVSIHVRTPERDIAQLQVPINVYSHAPKDLNDTRRPWSKLQATECEMIASGSAR